MLHMKKYLYSKYIDPYYRSKSEYLSNKEAQNQKKKLAIVGNPLFAMLLDAYKKDFLSL